MARRKRKKNTRRKKGGKIMSSIEQKSTKIDCTKNNIDRRKMLFRPNIFGMFRRR